MSTPFFSSPLGLAQPLPRDIAPSTLPTGSLAGIGAGPPPIGFLDGISLHFHVLHSPQHTPCLDFISTSRLRLRLALRPDGARNEVLAPPRLLDYAPARAPSVGFSLLITSSAALLRDPRSQ